jgi:hypothetical protein
MKVSEGGHTLFRGNDNPVQSRARKTEEYRDMKYGYVRVVHPCVYHILNRTCIAYFCDTGSV